MIPYRVGVQQRVFPAYRAPFFDALARSCAGGLSVFAGDPLPGEAIGQEGELQIAQRVIADNIYLGWGGYLLVWQHGLKSWLERWRPDVLIMEANPRDINTNMAIQWMHSRRLPVIGWGLGAPPVKRFPSWLFTGSRKRFLARFNALVSYSRLGVDQYQATGFPAERIFLAPNAATPRPPQNLAERPPSSLQRRRVVLFVGRLQARKRVDALIRACSRLPQSLQPRLVIVGDGPARDFLESEARKFYPAAEFVGEKYGDALRSYYQMADLFVLPGTGGLAVQEAMSHGLPVLVAEADGTQADLVREGNGWIVPPGDEDVLVEFLLNALSDPARLSAMGKASYRIVAEEVNLEKMVEVFAKVINTVSRKAAAR